jgi:hypothetical protein
MAQVTLITSTGVTAAMGVVSVDSGEWLEGRRRVSGRVRESGTREVRCPGDDLDGPFCVAGGSGDKVPAADASSTVPDTTENAPDAL